LCSPSWPAGPAIGCGREAIATSDALPVRRVVVYRNGVAYFERSGHVGQDEVRFKMKRSEVGDFLATLAVMERGGSSVRAAAFPIKVNDDDDSAEPACDASPAPVPPKPRELTEDEKKGLETVVLSLDGREHDLQVGYVAESPVWKPSYRLVVRSNGDADLQAWGIVENLSGEDWKNVHLSLIAGAPLAFRAQLGVPVIPIRPIVTDEGEVIASVPHGETSLQQESKSQPVAPSGAADEQAEAADKPASRRSPGLAHRRPANGLQERRETQRSTSVRGSCFSQRVGAFRGRRPRNPKQISATPKPPPFLRPGACNRSRQSRWREAQPATTSRCRSQFRTKAPRWSCSSRAACQERLFSYLRPTAA
jgi:hypothetical protein